jgi:hypothetical protein
MCLDPGGRAGLEGPRLGRGPASPVMFTFLASDGIKTSYFERSALRLRLLELVVLSGAKRSRRMLRDPLRLRSPLCSSLR